jgi:hypothetical protein
MNAAVHQRNTRSHQQPLDGLGHQHLPRSSEIAYALGDRHSQPGDVFASDFDLAGMQPRPNVEPEGLGLRDDLSGASHGARASVERGEEAVAGGLDLTTAVTLEGTPNDRIVLIAELAPRAMTDPRSLLGRIDDVGEQHRGGHEVTLRSLVTAGEELLNLVEPSVDVADVEEVVIAGKLDVLGWAGKRG